MNVNEVEIYEKKFPEGSIVDGIIDAEKYFNNNFRIAWFLKEAYSTEDNGFHIRKHYAQPDVYENFFRYIATPTWHPIIYCSYGIQNEFINWDNLPKIKDKPEMCDIIKTIAIINANKYPSKTGTYTTWPNLKEGFTLFRDLIDEQIKVLQPEIHIFCGTFYLYKDYFGLTDEHRIGKDFWWIMEKDGKLFLEVYHPANRKQKRQEYVNEIITAVNNWSKRKLAVQFSYT